MGVPPIVYEIDFSSVHGIAIFNIAVIAGAFGRKTTLEQTTDATNEAVTDDAAVTVWLPTRGQPDMLPPLCLSVI